MLLIGICDGDTAVRVMLSGFIERYKNETGLNVQVLSYDNGVYKINCIYRNGRTQHKDPY